jgi:hypothetical protein
VRVLNQRPGAAVWTAERLRRTVRRLAAEGIVEANLLDRARPPVQDCRTRLDVAADRRSTGGLARAHTTRWHRSSVQQLLAKAEHLRLD